MWESPYQWLLEPANQKFLLFLFAAFALGVILGGWWARRLRKSEKSGSGKINEGPFFKGIQYILSNEHDHAIQELTKSVRLDSNMIETYVALGNLFRSKGDIDRAIRIRQSIMLRPNLSEQNRLNTLFDLGLDYKKGGLLNRALDTFMQILKKSPSHLKTLEEIERIYEEMKDWDSAYKTRQKISRLKKGNHENILAHYLVEMGKIQQEKRQNARAVSLYRKAVSLHEECADAYLHLGDLYFSGGEYGNAMDAWKKVIKKSPQFGFLAYGRLEKAYSKMKDLKPVKEFLKDCVGINSDAFTHIALAKYLYNDGDVEGALGEIEMSLKLDSAFWEARMFKGEILLAQGKKEDALEDYADLIRHLDIPHLKYQCAHCGLEQKELSWQCPQCRKWDTIKIKI